MLIPFIIWFTKLFFFSKSPVWSRHIHKERYCRNLKADPTCAFQTYFFLVFNNNKFPIVAGWCFSLISSTNITEILLKVVLHHKTTNLPWPCPWSISVGQPAWQESSKVESKSRDFRFIFDEKWRSTLRLKYVGLQ